MTLMKINNYDLLTMLIEEAKKNGATAQKTTRIFFGFFSPNESFGKIFLNDRIA